MIPLTDKKLPAKSGEEIFSDQEEAIQLSVLGKEKFTAFREGKLKLSSLIGIKQSAQWGTTLFERSLKDALER
jgi:hypothetical protein